MIANLAVAIGFSISFHLWHRSHNLFVHFTVFLLLGYMAVIFHKSIRHFLVDTSLYRPSSEAKAVDEL